jgi:hypothetical protein
MPRQYARQGSPLKWSVAEAVRESLTMSDYDDRGALEALERKVEKVADAVGHLAEVLARIAAPEFVDAALNEIISYQFHEVEPDQ